MNTYYVNTESINNNPAVTIHKQKQSAYAASGAFDKIKEWAATRATAGSLLGKLIKNISFDRLEETINYNKQAKSQFSERMEQILQTDIETMCTYVISNGIKNININEKLIKNFHKNALKKIKGAEFQKCLLIK